MDFFECRELILNLGGYPERRAGAEFFRKDNKFIQVECPAPSEGVKWKPGKVVVYTPAEVAQLEEAHVIKQRRSAEQEAIQKAELLKKYGI